MELNFFHLDAVFYYDIFIVNQNSAYLGINFPQPFSPDPTGAKDEASVLAGYTEL